MLKKVDRLVCAWISLMLEKHIEEKGFSEKDILFTQDELVSRANSLFPTEPKQVNLKDIKDATIGIGNNEAVKYFEKESYYAKLFMYCRLSDQNTFQGKGLDDHISELIRVLIDRGSWQTSPKKFSYEDIETILINYYHDPVIRAATPIQDQEASIGTPEAVWLAAATLAYNEYQRSKTINIEKYAFSQRDIARVALSYNIGRNENGRLDSCNTMAGTICVKGKTSQPYAYLIAVGRKRRVSKIDEGALSQPIDLHRHRHFRVVTIDGIKTVEEIERFIKDIYSKLQANENASNVAYTMPPNADNNSYIEETSGNEYSEADFLSDIFMSKEDYNELVETLKHQKNIILCGAPGVGKTYAAKKLAYSVMGEQADERVMQVQFHQSYSYEDFIMGYRPVESGGFEIRTGAFYDFCQKAKEDSENDYFFIIDEINRGNLSRIFGELFMLIENSKRGNIDLPLLYRPEERFTVPKNLYIIGMMNTADRSLAMLDYALRRRFAFFEMKPGFETPQFKAYQADLGSDSLDRVISCVEELNHVIESDQSLGAGFCIGHSYFCNLGEDESEIAPKLKVVVKHDIIPMLREYWFDDIQKANEWGEKLLRAI